MFKNRTKLVRFFEIKNKKWKDLTENRKYPYCGWEREAFNMNNSQ
jgi:rubredoxin